MSKAKKFGAAGAIVLLAVLVGVLVFMTDKPVKAEGKWLSERETASIVSIGIVDDAQAVSVSIEKQDGIWRASHGNEVSAARMASLLAVLGYMKAEDVAENDAGTAEFGTQTPSLTINAAYEDGAADTYYLGISVPGKGTYLQKAQDEAVYLLDEQRSKTLKDFSKSLFSIPLDQVDFNRIVGVYLNHPTYGNMNINRSEAPRSKGDFYWNMAKPYPYYAKTQRVENIIGTVAEIGWVKISAEGQAEMEEFVKTDGPSLTLYDGSDRELRLTFGETTENDVYVRLNDEKQIYLMDQAVLRIFDETPEAMIDTTFYYYEPTSITECVLQWNGAETTLGALWMQDGDIKAQRYFLNGNVIAGSDYHDRAQMFSELQIQPESIANEALGESMGAIALKRLSPPYEQTIRLWGLRDRPQEIGVDYGNGVIGTVKADAFASLAEQIAA